MKIFELLAHFHNWLADKDFIWWPFSFLRPHANEPITFKLTLIMTLYFGALGFAMFTAFALVNNALNFSSAFMTFIMCFVGFFLWFNIITRPLWNIRAKKISSTK